MIRKVKGGWRVVAESGPHFAKATRGRRNMGTYPTKAEAEKRLRQIEIFKHLKKRRTKP